MSILDNIKNYFFSKENKSTKVDTKVFQEPIKGDVEGICAICKHMIGSNERIRMLSGHPVHKSCIKYLTKMTLEGNTFEKAVELTMDHKNNQKEVNIDGIAKS